MTLYVPPFAVPKMRGAGVRSTGKYRRVIQALPSQGILRRFQRPLCPCQARKCSYVAFSSHHRVPAYLQSGKRRYRRNHVPLKRERFSKSLLSTGFSGCCGHHFATLNGAKLVFLYFPSTLTISNSVRSCGGIIRRGCFRLFTHP